MSKAAIKKIVVNTDWCKGCGICVHFCPKKVLGLNENEKITVLNEQDCICCMLCEQRCPDFAIEIETE